MSSEECLGIFDECMLKGERLRQLRLLEKADEEERQKGHGTKKRQNQCKERGMNQDGNYSITMEGAFSTISITRNSNIICKNSFTGYEEDISEIKTDSSNFFVKTNTSSLDSFSQKWAFHHDDGMIFHESDSYEDDMNQNDQDCHDKIDILPTSKLKILRYNSYVSHQRYNDDYKHADCNFIDFGYAYNAHHGNNRDLQKNTRTSRLIIEQQKSLGKGGLVWNAAIILADYVIASQDQWMKNPSIQGDLKYRNGCDRKLKLLDLGAGTGVTSLMIAKAIQNVHIYATDLPDVIGLIERNIKLNFPVNFTGSLSEEAKGFSSVEDLLQMDRGKAAQDIPKNNLQTLLISSSSTTNLSRDDLRVMYEDITDHDDHDIESLKHDNYYSLVTGKVLRWGMREDYCDGPFDVIVAADVVSSLYDPSALAQTIHDLCHEKTIVYICGKRRLDKVHDMFDNAMKLLFDSVNIISPDPTMTRLKKLDNISIMIASGKT